MKRVFILAGANGSGKGTVELTLVAHGNGNVVFVWKGVETPLKEGENER